MVIFSLIRWKRLVKITRDTKVVVPDALYTIGAEQVLGSKFDEYLAAARLFILLPLCNFVPRPRSADAMVRVNLDRSRNFTPEGAYIQSIQRGNAALAAADTHSAHVGCAITSAQAIEEDNAARIASYVI